MGTKIIGHYSHKELGTFIISQESSQYFMEIAGQKFSLTGYQEEGQNFMLTPKEGIFRGFMFEPVEKENKVSLKLEKTQEVYILN